MTAPAERGTTVIADRAVRRIAEQAAREALPGGGGAAPRGAASVSGRRARVALRLTLPYPGALSPSARRVRDHVAERTRELTGLTVSLGRLSVARLAAPPGSPVPAVPVPPPLPAPPAVPPPVPPGRPSAPQPARGIPSPRRVPALLVMVVAAVLCAAVTVDVIRVRAGDGRAAGWRLRAVGWLAHHGAGSTPVTVLAAAAAVVGLVLLVLALSPGHRRRLPLAAPGGRRRIVLDRATAAVLIRDAVGDVDGVGKVSVVVRRRRVTVRAGLAFGDPEATRKLVAMAAHQRLAGCLLPRAPRLVVTVEPEPAWQPPGDAASPRRAPIAPPLTAPAPASSTSTSGKGAQQAMDHRSHLQPQLAANRLLLSISGVALLAGGAWASLARTAAATVLPWWPGDVARRPLLGAAALDGLRAHGWWAPAVITVGVAATLLLLLGAVSRLRRPAPARLPLAAAGTELRTRALAEAVQERAEAIRGVARSRVRLQGRRTRLQLYLTLQLTADTTPEEVVGGLDAVIAEARTAAAPRPLQVDVRLSHRRHRRVRVR